MGPSKFEEIIHGLLTRDKYIRASDSISPIQFAATMRGMVMLP